jgi:tetratricopeptide (TPR) repeat protein
MLDNAVSHTRKAMRAHAIWPEVTVIPCGVDGIHADVLDYSRVSFAAHHWMSSAGTSKLHLAQDEEAVTWFRRAIEANRNFAFTHLSLAAALAHLGRIDEARTAAKIGLTLEQSFTTIGRFRAGGSE